MDLLDQIEACWKEAEAETLVDKWAAQLKNNKPKIIEAVKTFREWDPLHVYLTVTKAMNPHVSFSLRYQGQEVAILKINGDVRIKISADTAKNNEKYFNLNTESEFLWRSDEGANFRKYFKNPKLDKKGRIHEHRIESEFLKQMSDNTSKKFDGTLKGIQPVLLADCPFQFPLPISGNTGIPKATRGNIDILARRTPVGGITRISIWELKKPGNPGHAIEQAYIYAVTLIKMLRSKESGKIWYQDIIGFSGDIPDKLTIESVVAVSIKNQAAFTAKLQKFKENNILQVGSDTIKLVVAYYQEDPLKVDLHEL